MGYDIFLSPSAFDDLESLPDDLQRRVYEHIDELAANPRPSGVKVLQGAPGGLRLRVGTYRILYLVNDRKRAVTIYKIGHRRDVYR